MVRINDIQKLPKSIMLGGELHELCMYVTALGKLAVAYKKCIPNKKPNEIIHILTQVVEPDNHKVPTFSNDINDIVDVPNLQVAFKTLEVRVQEAIKNGVVKIYGER